jgi:toxin ParE1/3/4
VNFSIWPDASNEPHPLAIGNSRSAGYFQLHPSTWGEEQEDRYLKGLWSKLAEIQSSPKSCRLRNDLAKGCCSTRHEKHVIFFSVKGQTLQVIRILHGAMDFNRHLVDEASPG